MRSNATTHYVSWFKFGGREALASYGYNLFSNFRSADLPDVIPAEHIEFIKRCRDSFETVRHIFVHAYYDPDRPLHEQSGAGLRWSSLPMVPARHCSGKVAIVHSTGLKANQRLVVPRPNTDSVFCGEWDESELR